jgi:ribosomal protein L9
VNSQDLRMSVEVSSGQLRLLERDLRNTVTRLGEIGTAGQKGGAEASAGLQRVKHTADQIAQARVRTAAISRRASEQELAALQRVARTAKRGSVEQMEANRLVAASSRRLGLTQVSAANEGTAAFRREERALERLGRGGLAASGIFSRFGRALAFGSITFLGGATLVDQIRQIAEASQDADRTQKALRTQLAATGISYAGNRREIQSTVRAQSRLAAVNDEEVTRSLTVLVRATGDLTEAERINAIALDVAAAKHKDVISVATVLGKVYGGNIGAARRLGITLDKNVKSPLEALNIIQSQFAGQAVAAGATAGGAFERIHDAIKNVREALGAGLLPVISRDLNAVAARLDDPATIAAIERFGTRVSHGIEGALESAVHFVEQNWPTIESDFRTAASVLEQGAHAAGDLAGALQQLAAIVPARGSLLRLLVEGALINKLARGRLLTRGAATVAGGGGLARAEQVAGEGALAGVLARRGGGARGAAIASSVAIRAPGLARAASKATELAAGLGKIGALTRLGAITVAVDLIVNKKDRKDALNEAFGGRGSGSEQIRDFLHLPSLHLERHLPKAIAYPFGLGRPKELLDPAAEKRASDRVERAISGGMSKGADEGSAHFNERIRHDSFVAQESAKTAAAAASKAFDTAFQGAEDKILQAFDARSEAVLSSFDEQTQRLEQKLSATVRVPSLHETFTVTVDGKTPAERELEALDKLQQKRTFRRQIFDARQQLSQARQVGDPVKIREAERALQDAEGGKRHFGLEQRAAAERKAADEALEARKAGFERRRAQQRRDLEAERTLQHEHLQAELEAEKKAIQNGRLTAAQGQRAIVTTMRKYGVNYRLAGVDLGAAFKTGLRQALVSANHSIDRLARKLAAVNRSAAHLRRVSQAAADGGGGGGRGAGGTRAPTRLERLVGIGPQGPIPPLDAERAAQQRRRRHDRREGDVDTLVALHPGSRRLRQAIGAVGLDVRVPAALNPAALRRIGGSLPLAALEDLLFFLRHNHLRPVRHAEGGVIAGPPGRDVIPARLTRGEVVFERGQQRALARKLGIGGGPEELFRHVQRLAASPFSSSTRVGRAARFAEGGVAGGSVERFAGGGVAGLSLEQLLRELTRQLAHSDLQRGIRHPVHIEQLVGRRLGTRGERRLGHRGVLRLEQRLAQEQAHPFLASLLQATPTGTLLGAAGRTGRARLPQLVSGLPGTSHVRGGGGVTFTGKVDIHVNESRQPGRTAAEIRSSLLKHAQRGYGRKRGANGNSNLGLG